MICDNGLPASPDIERLVLGAILLDGRQFDAVAGTLVIEDFIVEKHREIFRRMHKLQQRGEKIDRVTVVNELSRCGQLEACGGLSYLVSLDDGLPQIVNLDSYAKIIKEKSVLRRIMFVSQHAMNLCKQGKADSADILAGAMAMLKTLASSQPQEHSVGLLLSDVQPQNVEWLWTNRIPIGKITMLDGDPSVGKSLLTVEIAARLTRGETLPGGDGAVSGGVVLLNGEDSLGDTVVPRLIAAGADLRRILAPKYAPERTGVRTVNDIVTGIPVIEEAITKVSARLVIIDVLMAYLPAFTNADRDQHARLALAPLAEMADRLGVAVICIRHLRKSAAVSPLYRGGGSIGIIGAARAAMLATRDPDDPSSCILTQTKSNVSAIPPSLRYGIVADHGAPRIWWGGESPQTAATVLDISNADERCTRAEARDFLREELSNGMRPVKQLVATARSLGISDSTLRRAKSELGVVSAKQEFNSPWLWGLPQKSNCEDGQENKLDAFPVNGRASASSPVGISMS